MAITHPFPKGPAPVGRHPASGSLDAKAPAPKPSGVNPEDLSNKALLTLLNEVTQELGLRSLMQLGSFREEFERTISDAITDLERLTPNRPKATVPAPSAVKSGLSPAKLKAVRAACEAGVPMGQVARHFGLSRAEVRKALDDPR